MQTNRATKRENCGDAAGTAKHDCEASSRAFQCQSAGWNRKSSVLVRAFWNKGAIAFIEIFGRADA